jgi:hypothetical protein
VQALVKGYLLPKALHPAHDNLSPIHRDRLTRSEEQGKFLPGVQDVEDVVVLICGHGGRDMRCGVLGPVLKKEFERQLGNAKMRVLKRPVNTRAGDWNETGEEFDSSTVSFFKAQTAATARVGLISHIGGHKFAGNVILYIPPGSKTVDGKENPLAGCGIWYGRVEPKHVEGIVRATILLGTVIEELFRGGIRQGGEILRL